MSTHADANGGIFLRDVNEDVALHRYQTLVNTIADGIYQLDADGNFVAVNDVFLETTGYTRDELLGEHVSLLFEDADIEHIERTIESQLETNGDDIATFELTAQTADGDTVPFELRLSLLIEDSEFRGTISVARDRSEKERRQDAVESTTASYESITSIIDKTNIGIYVLTEDSKIAWADETFERYFGLEQGDLSERNSRTVINDTLKTRFADPNRFAETILSSYEDDSYIDHFECRVSGDRDNIEERWLKYQSKPLESGEFAGGRVELYYDITDQKESEGALRESQEAFESLVNTVEEYAIFRLDTDGHVISWNRGAQNLKGYDREEILGEHFSTFYTSADRAADVPEQNLEAATENGSTEDRGWRVRKDGTRFWANVTITDIRDDDGTHRGYLKVTRDMTARHEREQELESELQRILSRISDAFYAVDDEYRFTHVNERAAELLQHSEEELLGEQLWEVFPDLVDLDEVWDAFHTALETQEPTSYKLYYDTLDFWVEANLYPSETGISVYFRDVTDQKEREQALEKSEQRYRTLAEYFPNGVVMLFNHDLEYTLAAGQGFDKIPVVPADLEGNQFHDVWPDETAEAIEPALYAALDGEEQSVELEYEGRDWVLYVVPITDSRGDIFAGVTMAHDITERKENERKLEETISRLEESNKRLEQFAYAASHDLQEPLRMVSSYLQLIERRYADKLDEEGEEFLEFAVDGADRMRNMIDGLLAYSRIETGGEPLEPVNLDSTLQTVLKNLQIQIEETDAEITTEHLPHVRGDDSQLRQVFQNLLSNAIEYSGDEPPRIHIDCDRRGQEWVISVHDEGVGIDLDDKDRIFEIFERLHSREEHSGTGIGLAICQRVIERHGGDIWVDSEPDKGTTFSFTLPASRNSTQSATHR